MKTLKKSFIVSIVICVTFCLLSMGIMQPVQMAQAMSVKSDLVIDEEKIKSILADLSIDTTRASERIYTFSTSDISLTLQLLDEGYIVSYVADDDEIVAYEVTTEMRTISNTSTTLVSTPKSSDTIEKVVFINGTETFAVPMDKLASPPDSEYSSNPQPSRGTTYYKWDNINFMEGSGFFDYAHPDKNYYSIYPYDSWVGIGNYLLHIQLDQYISSEIVNYFYDLGGILGFIFGLIITAANLGGALMATVMGAVVSEVIGSLFAIIFSIIFCDADGCLWFWINIEFFNWVYSIFFNPNNWYYYPLDGNFWNLVQAVAYGFGSFGYLRIGPTTLWDETSYPHIGDPCPPPPTYYYALSATSSSTGNGYVDNKDRILNAPDGSYTYLNSGSFGNKAEITATLSSTPISGTLNLKCYTTTSNGANLKVYVCNQYGVWTIVKNTNLYPANIIMTINCGYVTNIVKVSIVAYHEYNGYPSYIYADATWVVV